MCRPKYFAALLLLYNPLLFYAFLYRFSCSYTSVCLLEDRGFRMCVAGGLWWNLTSHTFPLQSTENRKISSRVNYKLILYRMMFATMFVVRCFVTFMWHIYEKPRAIFTYFHTGIPYTFPRQNTERK